MDRAAGNTAFRELLYNMFNDMDLRSKLKNPFFYLRLLKN
jgi:hypothetical protein